MTNKNSQHDLPQRSLRDFERVWRLKNGKIITLDKDSIVELIIGIYKQIKTGPEMIFPLIFV